MMCLWIVKSITSLKTPEGPLYHSTTKKKNYKANDVLIVKSITSLKTPKSPLYLLKDSISI